MTRVLAFGYATLAAMTVAIAAVGMAEVASAASSKFAGVKVNGGDGSAAVALAAEAGR